jgi:hypothetical protein
MMSSIFLMASVESVLKVDKPRLVAAYSTYAALTGENNAYGSPRKNLERSWDDFSAGAVSPHWIT